LNWSGSCHKRRINQKLSISCPDQCSVTSVKLPYVEFLFFFYFLLFAPFFSVVSFFLCEKKYERNGKRLVDTSSLLVSRSVSAPEQCADRAADQSMNATQEWGNFPSRIENRIPRKRAKVRSLRL